MPGRARTRSALDLGVGGDHHHRVHRRVAAGLEQQGDVEHGQFHARASRRLQIGQPAGGDQRVDDGLQPLEGAVVAAQRLGQPGAVHGAVHDHAGKGLADRSDRRAARAHRGRGPPRRRSRPARLLGEHGRGGRLAHADGAGQAEEDHRASPPDGPAARARTSTSGGGDAEEGLERRPRLADQHGQAVHGGQARAPARPAGRA